MNKNRGLLLDRDGVINADTSYVGRIEDFSFLPGVFPFLREAQNLGFRLAILTNQSGVARGYYTEDDFNALTASMLDKLRIEGIGIDLVLACFEHPEGTLPAYARQSFWRKPKPGMLLEALRRLQLEPKRSAFLGDAKSDMEAALAGGIGTPLWLAAHSSQTLDGVKNVRNYNEALSFLRDLSA